MLRLMWCAGSWRIKKKRWAFLTGRTLRVRLWAGSGVRDPLRDPLRDKHACLLEVCEIRAQAEAATGRLSL